MKIAASVALCGAIVSTAVEAFAPAANSLAQSAVTSSSSSSELHFFGGGSASKSDLDEEVCDIYLM